MLNPKDTKLLSSIRLPISLLPNKTIFYIRTIFQIHETINDLFINERLKIRIPIEVITDSYLKISNYKDFRTIIKEIIEVGQTVLNDVSTEVKDLPNLLERIDKI